MALDPSAFSPLLNFAPLNQSITGFRNGMDANADYRAQQNVGSRIAAGDWQGAQAAAGQGGMDPQVLISLNNQRIQDDERQRQQAALARIQSDPNYSKFVTPQSRLALDALSPADRAKALVEQTGPDLALRREQMSLNNRDLNLRVQQHADTFPLEKRALELRVQEADQKANDPINSLIRDAVRSGTQQPAPQGGLQKQSFDGQPVGDPNLIRVQQAQPQQQGQDQQAAPQQEMVDIGLGKPIPAQTAKLIALSAYKSGNHQFGKFIEDQIGSQLAQGAKTELDKNRINYTNAIGRLDSINKTLDDKFLRTGTQINQWMANIGEKAGVPMSPQMQQEAMQFHGFRSNAIGHFNATLKELSGTAVSQQEFDRIKAQMPNPGTGMVNGVLDGDGPTQFKAKMQAATMSMKLALARSNYLAGQGFKGDANSASAAMPLDSMPSVIQRRTQQLQQGLQQQGVKPEDIPGMVQHQLKKDFGI